MTRGHFTSAGVGRWEKTWTQNFAAGQSFVGLDEAERAAGMRIKGAVLGPQPAAERQWAAGNSPSGKTFDPLAR